MKNPKIGDKVAWYKAIIGAPTLRFQGVIKHVHGRKCFVDFKNNVKYCVDRTQLIRLTPPVEPPTPRTRWTLEKHNGENSFQLFDAPTCSKVAKAYQIRGIGFKKVMWREVL